MNAMTPPRRFTEGQIREEYRKKISEQAAEIERLRAALRALHDEMDEYQHINNLSAYNNHVMRQARAALGEEKK